MEQRFGKHRSKPYAAASEDSENNEIIDISDPSSWESKRSYNEENREQVATSQVEAESNDLSAFPDGEELTITTVQLLKSPKFRYRIYFGPFSIEVHEDIMVKYRMMKGAVFTKHDLEEIVIADERQRGYGEALKYLSRKPRTSFEIASRLKEKGWSEDTIGDVIERLIQERWINDAAYAQEWAGQRLRSRGKGKAWIRHELRQKGISKPLIEEALGQVSEEDEYDSAMQLAQRKWRTTSGETADKKRKIGAFLMRRGFSGQLVGKVVRELVQKDGMEDGDEWED
ncbi:RecX family transcriptional regulator [Paenibacillus sp. D2_2]|uniref:regulatory protein RecX n=1 Tax=Paenibacillus sp. D2_2 TaxID=3073092 RepID=UPI002814F6F9|nr:RecX family transcriptional regulator [Paenibacillus sp. D2_2]WMT39135.1 RecX family transcriptional regulator [Paenibacillus sp. D2_2]